MPTLAQGVELLGEYKDTGFREPVWIVRRPDGRVIQLPRLLQLVLEEIDGTRDVAEISERLTVRLQRPVSPGNVTYLIDSKLHPAGVAGLPGQPAAQPQGTNPLMAPVLRVAVIPSALVQRVSRFFAPLFVPWIVGAVLLGLIVFDIWLFAQHSLGPAVEEVVVRPALLLCVFGLLVASTAFHELGHAAACRYGSGRPGVIGVGLFMVWPVFYTDVTDAYRFGRSGRLRTDLGGLYFNALFILGTAAVYARTQFEPLLVFVLIQHMLAFQQLMPWPRLDGYFVLSDLTGVPDILIRIRPLLAGLVARRRVDSRVAALKGWVRAVVSVYIIAFIALLIPLCVLLVRNLPRILRQSQHSIERYGDLALQSWQAGHTVAATLAILQIVILLLPLLGIAVTLAQATRLLKNRVF